MTPTAAARLGLAVSLVVLALKAVAYRLTGSVSLYSDALESVVNVAAAAVALVAIRVAAAPPDEKHPYGHTKAEYVSAVVEGAMILFAAVEIVRAAWGRLAAPVALDVGGAGLAVAVAATVLNAVWAVVLVRTGRAHRSPALVADGRHLWSDVVSTVGVLAGIGLAVATGWWVLDPLLAILVAVNVVVVGIRLIRESVGGLMDESIPVAERETIREVLLGAMGEAIEVHALRARRAGHHTFVEFHLVLPGETTVEASHALCDRLEAAVHAAVPASSVTVHVEPEAKAKGHGGVVVVGADVPHTFT
ncbi:MAG TPA: cation diffusion facilitator family transporter [Rubricoccaceae bacterium]